MTISNYCVETVIAGLLIKMRDKTCGWDKITATTHARKCCGDMTQEHVAATRPLV